MVIKIYDTLTKKKKILKPIDKTIVKIFLCGPTVYNYIHIGNARTITFFDTAVKYLRYKGYNVFYLQNITDIDDKIINKAVELKIPPKKVAEQYEHYYYEDMKSLGVNSVSKYARATSYIEEIKSQVERLVKKGFAYETNDGVYFEVSKFKDFGKLSHQDLNQIKEHSRIEENENKKNFEDFVIWKKKKFDYEPSWPSDFSLGRPGWHIEDTAITEKEFGSQYDIHGGAIDLIFPHHEAEIAQMESLSGKKPLVNYWMHAGFLNLSNEKMSKSLGNVFTLREMLRKYPASHLRYVFLSTKYTKPLDFTLEVMDNAKNSLERINEVIIKLNNYKNAIKDNKKIKSLIKKARLDFEKQMDDDFEIPNAISVIFNFINELNPIIAVYELSTKDAKSILTFFNELNNILGIFDMVEVIIPDHIKELVKKRDEARKKKDFKLSDELRDSIKQKGYYIDDTKGEPVIKKLSNL